MSLEDFEKMLGNEKVEAAETVEAEKTGAKLESHQVQLSKCVGEQVDRIDAAQVIKYL